MKAIENRTKRKEDNYEEVIYQALVHNDALGIQEKVLEVEKEKLKISFSR
ncbi:TolC family protein, partial [Fusobacterium necrophorum]